MRSEKNRTALTDGADHGRTLESSPPLTPLLPPVLAPSPKAISYQLGVGRLAEAHGEHHRLAVGEGKLMRRNREEI